VKREREVRRPPSVVDSQSQSIADHGSRTTNHGLSQILTPTRLLAIGIIGYIVVFTLAAWYKYATYQMGFDLGVHQQVLWNTAHGRIAATSAFADTDSYLGIDIIPTELLLAPIYALIPSIYTMLFLQALALGLGALPVFWLVRDRFSGLAMSDWRLASRPQSPIPAWAGLAFAAAFLLYLPVEYMNLYEFQIRAFATTFLLLALYALERRRFRPFLLWSLLALGCRADVGFVVAGMGVYMLLDARRKMKDGHVTPSLVLRPSSFVGFGVLPIVLGLSWVVLCVAVLIPLFRSSPFLYTQIIYSQFGDSFGAIVRTVIARPGYVAAYVFSGADGVARLQYLVAMFLPFGFLLLLQPRMLLITLPIFALNLLSNTPNIHASIQKHYQALIIPFMVVGSAYGLHWLLTRNDERRTLNDEARTASGHSPFRDYRSALALVGIVILALACNIGYRNPFFSLLTRPADGDRIAAIHRLLARVPADARLTTTSKIGPFASQREWIFFFPGNVIYPEAKAEQGQYLLIDTDPAEARPEGLGRLAQWQASGRYRRLAEEQGIALWQRVAP
jgi:uncharacterized membrane protein